MRCRLVYEQSSPSRPGIPHVSAVVLGEDEVQEQLSAEASIHEMAGWTVTRSEEVVVARRGDITRIITVRRSEAMEDSGNLQKGANR